MHNALAVVWSSSDMTIDLSFFVVLNNDHHPAKEAYPLTLCCN